MKTTNKISGLDKLSIKLISSSEKFFIIDNLQMLVSSGMSIISSLKAIEKETKSKLLRRILSEISTDIESGSYLWRSLIKYRLFSDHTVSLIKIGEESGRLAENLKMIAVYQQRDQNFKSKLRSALTYPLIVMFFAVIIGSAIAWFILPKLATVFSKLRLNLPLSTKILIAIGEFLGRFGIIAVPLFIVIFTLIIYFVFFDRRSKFIGEKILLFIPATKKLILEIEISRFGYALGTLLDSGLPILEALKSLLDITTFVSYRRLYHQIYLDIESGSTFEKSFAKIKKTDKLIPNPVQQMIVSAELSGKIPETLIQVGKNYEFKVEETTKNLSVIFEPILLILVWLIVAFIALSVILPIYGLIGGFNNSSNASGTAESSSSTSKKLAEVIAEEATINVFEQPLEKAAVVSQVLKGDVYDIQSEKPDWFEIILSTDKTAWIKASQVKVSQSN